MDTDTILDNIENFFNTASPETLANIQKILSTPSEDDDLLEEYFDNICDNVLPDN